MRSWLGGSSPVIGSSRSSRPGCAASAWAMRTRCCWPPDSSSERSVEEIGHIGTIDGSVDRRVIGGAHPADETDTPVPAHADDLGDGERHPPVLVVLLDHECRVVGERIVDRSARGCDQSGERVEQRRLAAAVRSDQGRHGGRADLERRSIEGGDAAEADDQVRGSNRRRRTEVSGEVGWTPMTDESTISRMVPTRIGPVALPSSPSCWCSPGAAVATTAAVRGGRRPDGRRDDVGVGRCRRRRRPAAASAGIEVAALIPAGADPHGYEPSLQRSPVARRTPRSSSPTGSASRRGVTDLLEQVEPDRLVEMADLPEVDVATTTATPHIWLDPTHRRLDGRAPGEPDRRGRRRAIRPRSTHAPPTSPPSWRPSTTRSPTWSTRSAGRAQGARDQPRRLRLLRRAVRVRDRRHRDPEHLDDGARPTPPTSPTSPRPSTSTAYRRSSSTPATRRPTPRRWPTRSASTSCRLDTESVGQGDGDGDYLSMMRSNAGGDRRRPGR